MAVALAAMIANARIEAAIVFMAASLQGSLTLRRRLAEKVMGITKHRFCRCGSRTMTSFTSGPPRPASRYHGITIDPP